MNDIPINWSDQIREAYPARSGVNGWSSSKLMLACRRALMDHTWGEIIDGCQRYKAYCQTAGKEGSEFVQSPLRFISDGSYLEAFTHQAPESKEEIERARLARLASERMQRAIASAIEAGSALRPYPQESAGAFETRIALATTRGPQAPLGVASDGGGGATQIGERVVALANRMRSAK